MSEALKPAASTWKAWYASLGAQKGAKLAALQSKLQKAMAQDQADKKSGSIKTLNHAQAVRIENKEKGAAGAGAAAKILTPAQAAAAAAHGKGPAAGKLSLATIKQQSKSLSAFTAHAAPLHCCDHQQDKSSRRSALCVMVCSAKSTWTVPR